MYTENENKQFEMSINQVCNQFFIFNTLDITLLVLNYILIPFFYAKYTIS